MNKKLSHHGAISIAAAVYFIAAWLLSVIIIFPTFIHLANAYIHFWAVVYQSQNTVAANAIAQVYVRQCGVHWIWLQNLSS